MTELTTRARKAIPTSMFAIPERRAYPIHDPSHARNALSRVAQHGTSSEKSRVRSAVQRKWGNLIKVESQKRGGK